jgi:hypothetical protein
MEYFGRIMYALQLREVGRTFPLFDVLRQKHFPSVILDRSFLSTAFNLRIVSPCKQSKTMRERHWLFVLTRCGQV